MLKFIVCHQVLPVVWLLLLNICVPFCTKFCSVRCYQTGVTLMTAMFPYVRSSYHRFSRSVFAVTRGSIQSSWRVGSWLSLPTQDIFLQELFPAKSSVLYAVGCSSSAHGELRPHFNFRGVTFKLSVTTLSLEFFIAGIFVLLLEKLSNPRKHAVWNDLMLLEVFPFFFPSFSASACS